MAFGIDRSELITWKHEVSSGNISFLTHYWMDKRFPGCYSVTKVGCSDLQKLMDWGKAYNLQPQWIHRDENYPHFDLFGDRQKRILANEGKWDQIDKFNL
ncbi:hypothetical protein [Virgibacillus siamensis]|uniref:hypothetical protein n=1 Tax=Virgibacillus siamensis TaxID=480071 RepID=UPI0009850A7B|nr:hypothetical protein [Virgibacillus siamensis]